MNKYEVNIIGGLDIGNGYTKGKVAINGDKDHPVMVDLPSCVSYISPTRWIPTDPDRTYLDDFWNELDCDITSEAISTADAGRVIFGRRAVESGNTPVIFNISDHVPKCDDSLSSQLVLGCIASAALRYFYNTYGELPQDTLKVSTTIGLALPIADFVDYHDRYRHKFMASDHQVYIHNFDRDVVVDIHFNEVAVLAEGAAAQYAITELGKDMLDLALDEARSAHIPIDASETGDTLVHYTNTIGVDVGEGTVNFPVFRNGKVSVENSSSINKGYGTVLQNVVEQVRNMSFAPQSRKDLAEFMLKPYPNAQQRKLRNKLETYIDAETAIFARDVIMEYKAVLNRVKLNADVVYVYGGGANSVRNILWPALVEASKLDDDIYTPVIYLNSAYSRDLNRNGLYMVAKIAEDHRLDRLGKHTLA